MKRVRRWDTGQEQDARTGDATQAQDTSEQASQWKREGGERAIKVPTQIRAMVYIDDQSR